MSDIKPDVATADANLESNENPEINAEETLKKKYGGIVPKKPPLISKDHERAYFDSADWALGKQGGAGGHAHKPKGPLEALRPKLQLIGYGYGESRSNSSQRGHQYSHRSENGDSGERSRSTNRCPHNRLPHFLWYFYFGAPFVSFDVLRSN